MNLASDLSAKDAVGEFLAGGAQGAGQPGADAGTWQAALSAVVTSKIEARLAEGWDVVSDRYLASSVAYGEAFGLDASWLLDIQRFLPKPSLTILLDIAPETAIGRKSTDRDRYERDLALQRRVRDGYRRLATADDWLHLDGERPKDVVAADVIAAVTTRLALP